jgi:ribosome-interacting GTPase 1
MPTNLPPEYFEVERRYREATSPAERIALLEELISTVPKHKGTDRLRADLRRRLSKLKAAAQVRKRTNRQDSAYRFDREGAGQVVVIGPTNVGKSALVAALTNATPEVANSPYTTWRPTPGMMPIENIKVQLVDTPPLDREFVEPGLLRLIRRSDLVLLVLDLQTDPIQQLEDATALLLENRIAPAIRREEYAGGQRMAFVQLLVLVNKYDDEDSADLFHIFCDLLEEDWPVLPVSAKSGRNLERLKQVVFEQLAIIRVYSKPPGQEPEFQAPFVMSKGDTVEDFAARVHRDFVENLKTARVWGSAEYDGQMVGRDYVLSDGDVVELRI